MRAFQLIAVKAAASHPDWNGCTADRRCEVWTSGDEARARALAHKAFWQEATPVKPDQSSPWTDPEMVVCEELDVPAAAPAPAEEMVLKWDERILAGRVPPAAAASAQNPDPSKKLDQH